MFSPLSSSDRRCSPGTAPCLLPRRGHDVLERGEAELLQVPRVYRLVGQRRPLHLEHLLPGLLSLMRSISLQPSPLPRFLRLVDLVAHRALRRRRRGALDRELPLLLWFPALPRRLRRWLRRGHPPPLRRRSPFRSQEPFVLAGRGCGQELCLLVEIAGGVELRPHPLREALAHGRRRALPS
uniref:Uncharacterized protein n=1 Tax=Arundo donax TaxID=35708 RepID=A0A0A9GT83_ARUDO